MTILERLLVPTGLAAAVLLAGCASAGSPSNPPSGEERRQVGTLVSEWSESTIDPDALARVAGTRLILEEAEREALAVALAPDVRPDELDAVDLDQSVLVVGAYFRCDEHSVVSIDGAGALLEFEVVKPAGDVACEWSPLQVDVWSIDRAVLADEVSLADDEGAPRVVGELVGRWSEAASGPGPSPVEEWGAPRLLTTPAERDSAIEHLDGSGLGREAVEEAGHTGGLEVVDLDSHVVVTVGYHRCDEYSRVVADPDGSTIEALVVQPMEFVCAWAPFTIDAWAIDRDELATDLVLAER